ncbi:MAG: hypothetical protein A3G44_15680 [Candidatus Rokubacteria bacterium RIFCSPLOWO2_12_FULL_73_47]|nr:MAG: hypothetical protein A3G44_15680 [Candidatus Rokubacteria bacterium RIFCSPLOWO2_12_FULL_73_47]
MPLGATIRRLRRTRGLSQEELARAARVTREYVTMIERGARRNPSLAILGRVARALGVPVGELLK